MRRSPLKRKSWLNRRGKKTRRWESVRAQLKRKFYRRGLVTCELRYPGCYRWQFLGFAHARKRRFLQPGELSEVILACSNCHAVIERLPHEEMYGVVTEVLARRADRLVESLF